MTDVLRDVPVGELQQAHPYFVALYEAAHAQNEAPKFVGRLLSEYLQICAAPNTQLQRNYGLSIEQIREIDTLTTKARLIRPTSFLFRSSSPASCTP